MSEGARSESKMDYGIESRAWPDNEQGKEPMNHLLLPGGLRFAGSHLALGWALRLLALLAGVLTMHLWIGPGPANMSVPVHGAASPVSLSSSAAGHISDPQLGIDTGTGAGADTGGVVLAAAGTATDRGASDGSSCAGVCPNGHSMMTAMCMVALLVIGAAGFHWLRSALLARWTLLRGPPVRTALPAFRPRTVSLVQLSISRT